MSQAPDVRALPGSRLLRKAPAAAALLIAVNDFWLKPRWPSSFVTGKLSDIGINFLLPIVIVAAVEMLVFVIVRSRFRLLKPVGVLACAGVSAVYFTLLKVLPSFTEVHAALLSLVTRPFVDHFHTKNVADLTDLVTLAMTPLAVWYLIRIGTASSAHSSQERTV